MSFAAKAVHPDPRSPAGGERCIRERANRFEQTAAGEQQELSAEPSDRQRLFRAPTERDNAEEHIDATCRPSYRQADEAEGATSDNRDRGCGMRVPAEVGGSW